MNSRALLANAMVAVKIPWFDRIALEKSFVQYAIPVMQRINRLKIHRDSDSC
jgi:hypothetical protein